MHGASLPLVTCPSRFTCSPERVVCVWKDSDRASTQAWKPCQDLPSVCKAFIVIARWSGEVLFCEMLEGPISILELCFPCPPLMSADHLAIYLRQCKLSALKTH